MEDTFMNFASATAARYTEFTEMKMTNKKFNNTTQVEGGQHLVPTSEDV